MLIGAAEFDTYLLPREIVVRRRVLIMGHPLTLPVLDAFQAERAIHVVVRACVRGSTDDERQGRVP